MAGLGHNTITAALAAVGDRLKHEREIEILLVGGAAGLLIDALPAAWTTADVDAIHFRLPQDRDAVLDAAAQVAQEMSLPADWLNDWGGLYAWTLPRGWERRRHHVGTFGKLRVFAASRADLIAMKFIAHRPQDLEHLQQMHVTRRDLTFVRSYLEAMAKLYPERRHPEKARQIKMARQYADAWEQKS